MEDEPLSSVIGTYDHQVLVLGAEDKGLSDGVVKKCDRLVAITGAGGSAGRLDSLNVAVAGGILIHGILPERKLGASPLLNQDERQ